MLTLLSVEVTSMADLLAHDLRLEQTCVQPVIGAK